MNEKLLVYALVFFLRVSKRAWWANRRKRPIKTGREDTDVCAGLTFHAHHLIKHSASSTQADDFLKFIPENSDVFSRADRSGRYRNDSVRPHQHLSHVCGLFYDVVFHPSASFRLQPVSPWQHPLTRSRKFARPRFNHPPVFVGVEGVEEVVAAVLVGRVGELEDKRTREGGMTNRPRPPEDSKYELYCRLTTGSGSVPDLIKTNKRLLLR